MGNAIMNTNTQASIGWVKRKSRGQQQRMGRTEIQAVAAVHPRAGFPFLVSSGGLLTTDWQNTFAENLYMQLTISATWASGKTATLTATCDFDYGDVTVVTTYSWKSGATHTNVEFVDLSNNVNFASIDSLTAFSGERDPTSTPTSISIATDKLSATLTWSDLTITYALTTQKTYDDYVQNCTNRLQWVSLLDAYVNPTKTYTCNYLLAGTGWTSDSFKLRFRSEFEQNGTFVTGTTWKNVANLIIIYPKRSGTNNVDMDVLYIQSAGTPPRQLEISSCTLPPYLPGIFTDNLVHILKPVSSLTDVYWDRGLFAFGINGAIFTMNSRGSKLVTSVNAIFSLKSAIRATLNMTTGVQNVLTPSTGANTESGFTSTGLSAIGGLYIFDPVPLMTSPPGGYVVDQTSGRFTTDTTGSFGLGTYGAIYWQYI